MALDGLGPWDMLELLVEHLEGADTTAITQLDADVWHEAQHMLSPEWEADPNAHLAFAVFPGIWRPLGEQHEGIANLDELSVDIRFTYRIRPDREPTDVRLSLRAADQLSRRALQHAWTRGACSLRMVTKAQVSPIPDQPYVQVVQSYILQSCPGD